METPSYTEQEYNTCMQCSATFSPSETGLGNLCSKQCLQVIEDLVSRASGPGSVFITGNTDNCVSVRVYLSLDDGDSDESHFAPDIRREFAKQCDPMSCPFLHYGVQYPCFDHFFQSGKVLKGINPTYTQDFWRTQEKWQSEYPVSPDKECDIQCWRLCSGKCRSRVYYCSCPRLTVEEAHDQILVPEYKKLLTNAPIIDRLRERIERGCDVVICDPFYVPDSPGGCDVVTREICSDKSSCYGLLVAAELL